MAINSMKQNETLLEKKFGFLFKYTFPYCESFIESLNSKNFIIFSKRMLQNWKKRFHNVSLDLIGIISSSNETILGEFVRVDLERMYEHQERSVKSLADRVDTTIESKLQNCKLILHIFIEPFPFV